MYFNVLFISFVPDTLHTIKLKEHSNELFYTIIFIKSMPERIIIISFYTFYGLFSGENKVWLQGAVETRSKKKRKQYLRGSKAESGRCDEMIDCVCLFVFTFKDKTRRKETEDQSLDIV